MAEKGEQATIEVKPAATSEKTGVSTWGWVILVSIFYIIAVVVFLVYSLPQPLIDDPNTPLINEAADPRLQQERQAYALGYQKWGPALFLTIFVPIVIIAYYFLSNRLQKPTQTGLIRSWNNERYLEVDEEWINDWAKKNPSVYGQRHELMEIHPVPKIRKGVRVPSELWVKWRFWDPQIGRMVRKVIIKHSMETAPINSFVGVELDPVYRQSHTQTSSGAPVTFDQIPVPLTATIVHPKRAPPTQPGDDDDEDEEDKEED